jgi:shikimate dehydrogenase
MRVGLIGNPVEHSRSPRMHNAAFRALGMNHIYELWHTEADGVGDRVASIRAADVAGANVTVPHKEAVMPYLDEVSATAQRIGAVNTIIPKGNRLVGDNTDAYGFRASIRERYGDISPQRAVVLGAGGASRAVIGALQEMGASEVLIANRAMDRAVRLAEDLNAAPLAWDNLADVLEATDVLVNATALGWHDEVVMEHTLVGTLPQHALVMDLTYRNTPLLQSAQQLNLRALDGLGMLIHQGLRSFEFWFGVTPPLDVMTAAAQDT